MAAAAAAARSAGAGIAGAAAGSPGRSRRWRRRRHREVAGQLDLELFGGRRGGGRMFEHRRSGRPSGRRPGSAGCAGCRRWFRCRRRSPDRSSRAGRCPSPASGRRGRRPAIRRPARPAGGAPAVACEGQHRAGDGRHPVGALEGARLGARVGRVELDPVADEVGRDGGLCWLPAGRRRCRRAPWPQPSDGRLVVLAARPAGVEQRRCRNPGPPPWSTPCRRRRCAGWRRCRRRPRSAERSSQLPPAVAYSRAMAPPPPAPSLLLEAPPRASTSAAAVEPAAGLDPHRAAGAAAVAELAVGQDAAVDLRTSRAWMRTAPPPSPGPSAPLPFSRGR